MGNRSLAWLLLASLSQPAIATQLEQWRQDVKVLASDEYEGRAPVSPGEKKTISYLKQRFIDEGLAPGYRGEYFQPVPLGKIRADQNMQLRIGDQTYQPGSEFVARSQRMQPATAISDSELVFVGYGITAPEAGWNDYAGVDVSGKTVVILVNDPGYTTQDKQLFSGNSMTYYGRWTYKYDEAMRQGAAGALIVHEDGAAGYPWSVVENSNTGSKFTMVDETGNAGALAVMGWLQRATAEQIFSQAGLNYQQEKLRASKPGFKPYSLKLSADLAMKQKFESGVTHNVVGMLPGSKYPDEAIIVSAHWDHLGVKPEKPGDNIFNGAVDNAAGVAGITELARMAKAAGGFERTLLFVSFGAEETGMLGSSVFAEAPPLPTANMVAVLNIDGMNVSGATDYVPGYGLGLQQLESWMAESAAKQGRVVKPDPAPHSGLFFRSDHFALARKGVPGLLFMRLGDNDEHYISHKYHRPDDEYSDDWDVSGVQQDLDLMFDIMQQLANSRDWPQWHQGNQFNQIRKLDQKH